MAEDVSSTIAALEDERYAAMLSGDGAQLITRNVDWSTHGSLPLNRTQKSVTASLRQPACPDWVTGSLNCECAAQKG